MIHNKMKDMKNKKYKEALLWAVALCVPGLFQGCSREDAPQQPGVSAAPHCVELGATIEGVAVSETKVTITDDTGAFAWSAGDQVAVHTQEGVYVDFTLEHVDANTGKGTFFGNLNGWERDRYAIYPASIAGTDDGHSPHVNLPDTYTIDTGDPDWKTFSPMPMVAKNEEASNQLSFKYACGLFRITLNDIPAGTDRITVTTGQNISGNFTVDVHNPDTPTLFGGSSTSVTFRFKEPLADADVSSGIILNLPVPASVSGMDYTSLTISVHNTDGSRTEKALGRFSKKIERGKGRKLAFSFLSPTPAGCLPGMFSVSPTKKVYFAKGNLTYDSGTWSFLDNSWTYNTSPSGQGATNGSQHFNWKDVFNAATTGNSTVKREITNVLGEDWNALSQDEWVYLLGYDRDCRELLKIL